MVLRECADCRKVTSETCARCGITVCRTCAYLCDQCGEMVCIKCLAVPGSDNSESVCCDCPACGPTFHENVRRLDRIRDGHMTQADAEYVAGRNEERKDLEEDR